MAGCGLSDDTFFSSFFYNYGSWETPSNQVRGGSVPGGVAPRAPSRALTWHAAGRQKLGRGWGGWGAKWVALSGSVPTGERRCPPPSPSTSSPVSRVCRVPPVLNLPSTPPPLYHLPAQREPEKEAGAGTLPRTTPGKTRELERNLPQVAAGAAPLCAWRLPALQLRRGAAELRVPRDVLFPPSFPPGPEPPLSLKWLHLKWRRPLTPRRGEGGQSGCSAAHDPAPPPARTSTPQTHTHLTLMTVQCSPAASCPRRSPPPASRCACLCDWGGGWFGEAGGRRRKGGVEGHGS